MSSGFRAPAMIAAKELIPMKKMSTGVVYPRRELCLICLVPEISFNCRSKILASLPSSACLFPLRSDMAGSNEAASSNSLRILKNEETIDRGAY